MFGRRLPRHAQRKILHPVGTSPQPRARRFQEMGLVIHSRACLRPLCSGLRGVLSSKFADLEPPNDDLLVASLGRTNGTSMIRFAKLRCKEGRQLASTAVATLALLVAMGNFGEAGSSRKDRSIESITTRTANEPIMAIVSLRNQRITVYDADGWIMRAPVSSGEVGRETPAGIFSVIQKDAEHHSNLYDDAYMPHMQRLTWSGIALHGGPVPGRPASHGCIRLPYDFAAHLFDLTKLGMRVIVAPSDVAPVFIAHPALFEPRPDARDAAAARVSEAEEAAKKADQARSAAFTASREVAQATMPLRRMRNRSAVRQ